jgi:hypothetical protein
MTEGEQAEAVEQALAPRCPTCRGVEIVPFVSELRNNWVDTGYTQVCEDCYSAYVGSRFTAGHGRNFGYFIDVVLI